MKSTIGSDLIIQDKRDSATNKMAWYIPYTSLIIGLLLLFFAGWLYNGGHL